MVGKTVSVLPVVTTTTMSADPFAKTISYVTTTTTEKAETTTTEKAETIPAN